MKNFQNMILAAGLGFALSSCENSELNGSAKISQTFQAKQSSSSSTQVSVPAGDYALNIKVSSSKTVYTLSNAAQNIQFSSKTPAEAKQGLWKDFMFPAASLKQNFSLVGKNETKLSQGESFSKEETCVYDTIERERCTPGYWREGHRVCHPGRRHCEPDRRHCRKVRDRSDDGYRCEWEIIPGRCYTEPGHCETTPREWIPRRCHTETDRIYGKREVYGRNVTRQNLLAIEILSLNNQSLGELSFRDLPQTSFETVRSGPCTR